SSDVCSSDLGDYCARFIPFLFLSPIVDTAFSVLFRHVYDWRWINRNPFSVTWCCECNTRRSFNIFRSSGDTGQLAVCYHWFSFHVVVYKSAYGQACGGQNSL